LFLVPTEKIYTVGSDIHAMKKSASLVKIAYKEALRGNYWEALTLNGLIYSSALRFNPSIAMDALMAGAIAAGLSGTGPAVAAIISDEKKDLVKDAWQAYDGKILETKVSNEKARVVR